MAASYKRGDERSLFHVQYQQGTLYEICPIRKHLAAASYISVHQNSVGVAGVSDKYGKQSWACYPVLWTLKHVNSLLNPDPTDIEALDAKLVSTKNVAIDLEAEAKRLELKRQAQEWAGITQDPRSDLFVFVGHWSKQKGVDLIADIMPSM